MSRGAVWDLTALTEGGVKQNRESKMADEQQETSQGEMEGE